MRILDVTLDFFRGEAISKTITFEDDTTVTIDINTNEVIDYEGGNVSSSKKKSIEDRLKINITL
jgi:hypothetical protein